MSYKQNLPKCRLVIAITAAFTTSMTAYSEDEAEEIEKSAKDSGIEEVVVTAQKRSQSINEVPMAISAVTAERMSEMGIDDTTDISVVVPGFTHSETAFGPPVYTLRGVGFNESSPQATSTVGVYIDEVAVPFPIMTKGAMIDMERIEVLKGPQGTLYGRNSTAGAINYIAAKPTEEFVAGVNASYGSFGTKSLESFVGGAISDSVRSRIAVKAVQSDDGWQESFSRDESLGLQDKLATRASFEMDLTDDTLASLTASYVRDQSDTVAPRIIYANFASTNSVLTGLTQDYLDNTNFQEKNAGKADWTEGRTPALNMTTSAVTFKLNHDLTDSMSITALTGMTNFKDEGSEYERGGTAGLSLQSMFDGVEAINPGWGPNVVKDYNKNQPLDYVASNDYVTQNGTIDSFSQELRIADSTDSAAWLAGVYYSESTVDYATTQDWSASSKLNLFDGTHPAAGIPIGLGMMDNEVNQVTETMSVFANSDWFINDDLTVTTGIRYAKDTASYTGCSADTQGDASNTFAIIFGEVAPEGECISIIGIEGLASGDPISQGNFKDTLEEDSLSWRFAANYEVDAGTSVFSSYSRGFKAGSYPSLGALSSDQLQPVVQEQLDAIELGMKVDLFASTAHLNATAYFYDYQDKQLLTKTVIPVFDTAFQLGNVPKSTVSGIEVDFQWLPYDGFSLFAAANYMKTEILEGVGFNQTGQKIDFKGSPLPFSPELEASLTGKYEWNLSGDMIAMIAVDASYTSEANHDFESSQDATIADAKYVGTSVEVNLPSAPYQYDDNFRSDAYTLYNARIGLLDAAGDWKAYLWGRNITDVYYVKTTVQNSEMQSQYAGMPRTFGLSVEYYWD